MNQDDADKFWDEMRRKNAHLIGGDDRPEGGPTAIEEDGSAFFNQNFPARTGIEEAYLDPDESILIVITTNEFESGRDCSTASHRRYAKDDKQYKELFARHRFGEKSERHHWLVKKFDEILGEGWGSELSLKLED
jgi:hypothetical protein